MKEYLNILSEKKWLTTITLGALAFSFILIVTLNLTLAFFSLIIFTSLGIFQRSFHYGLVFFLAVILIFPSVAVVNNLISTGEIFVLMLALIGVVSLFLDRHKIKILPLFYYWIGMVILFGILLFSSGGDVNVFYGMNQEVVNQFIMTFIIYPILIVSFQYFFQTTRRLERFFLIIVVAGTVQAIIGTILFSGFFEESQYFQIESVDWSMLLAITIPITLGMWLIQKSSLSTLEFLWFKKRRKNISQIVDVVLTADDNAIFKKSKETIVNLKQSRINTQIVLISSLLLQIIALIITFSYISLIAIGIGTFIVGVLMRNKTIVLTVLSSLLILLIFLPGFEPVLTVQLKQGILDILSSIKSSQNLELLWRGIGPQQGRQVNSTYLFIFSRLGFIGLLTFILGLVQYFREVRAAYLKSDEFERVWLVIILGIFIEFIFLGVLSNVFFVWPAALLFWLLYGALQNLKTRKKEYRLMETIL
jgi:hypothetical protein